MNKILEAKNIQAWYEVRGGLLSRVQGLVRAVDDVSLTIHEGEVVSLVGESGCGKSTLGLALLGLLPVREGELTLFGEKVNYRKNNAWAKHRQKAQMIFQDPYGSLNPRLTIMEALAEPLLVHGLAKPKELKDRVAQLLEMVELQPDVMNRFPHAFSGGQRQRISIARALGMESKLLVCDEIVSALDVSVQAQVLELLMKLKKELNLSLLFISHDLAVVNAISDRIEVMYLGKIVESGSPDDLLANPQHPYTNALIEAVPGLDRTKRPKVLGGEIPSPMSRPSGCNFITRCSRKTESCEVPPDWTFETNKNKSRAYACHHPLTEKVTHDH